MHVLIIFILTIAHKYKIGDELKKALINQLA